MTARPMTEETPEQLAQRVVDTWGDGNPPIVVLARALLSTSAAERRASPEPTDAELDDLADIIDEHVGEDHLAMERAAWHFVASRLSSAERGTREAAREFAKRLRVAKFVEDDEYMPWAREAMAWLDENGWADGSDFRMSPALSSKGEG